MKQQTWGERLCIIYAIFMVFVTGWQMSSGASHFKIAVTVLAIPCAIVPLVISKIWKKQFSSALLIWYIVFLFGSQFLGTVLKFYKLGYWDMLMHALAGVLLGFVGIELLMKHTSKTLLAQLSSAHVFWFVKGVGVFGGAMWEVYEFTVDQLFKTTMQGKGNPDTMTDLIFDLIGSYIVAKWYSNQHKKKYEQQQLNQSMAA